MKKISLILLLNTFMSTQVSKIKLFNEIKTYKAYFLRNNVLYATKSIPMLFNSVCILYLCSTM